jgi:hypothetical protein
MMVNVKAWFRNSLTIFWARLQWFVGIAGTGLIAAFSDYDFTQLTSMDAKTAFKMLAVIAVSGVLTELARRRTL